MRTWICLIFRKVRPMVRYRHMIKNRRNCPYHLYIAQVKQKCGIIGRENYNKAKSDGAKQPKCQPDKKRAVMEASRHFRLI